MFRRQSSGPLRLALFIIAMLAGAASASPPDDAWLYHDGPNPPSPVWYSGTAWAPWDAGDPAHPGRWYYVPKPIDDYVSAHPTPPVSRTIYPLTVTGGTWRLQGDSTGWHALPPWYVTPAESPPVAASEPSSPLGPIFIIVLVIIIVYFTIACIMSWPLAQHERQLAAEAFERQQRDILEATERQAVELKRKQAKEMADAQAVIDRSKPYEDCLPNVINSGAKQRRRAVKQAYLTRTVEGERLQVNMIAHENGMSVIEWRVAFGAIRPLRVIGRRDGAIMGRSYGLSGLYSDALEPGESYLYTFSAYDGERRVERKLSFRVPVPTSEQWHWKPRAKPKLRRPLTKEDLLQASQEEAVVEQAINDVDKMEIPLAEKRMRKATIRQRAGEWKEQSSQERQKEKTEP